MTARQLEIHPEALAEAEAALSWYGERSSRAPAALMRELDSALKAILEAPQRWPADGAGCRRFPMFRFLYLIVYREKQNNVIQILAVTHGRRRPRYWRTRS